MKTYYLKGIPKNLPFPLLWRGIKGEARHEKFVFRNALKLTAFLFSLWVSNVNAQNTFPSSGNTGIGTTTPATLLHITGAHGNTQSRLTLPAANNGGGTGEVNMQLWVSEPNITWEGGGIGTNVTNNGGAPAGFGRINTGLGQAYIRFITNGGGMAFNTTNNAGTYFPTMYMNNGLVGIGTTTPGALLHLTGAHSTTQTRLTLPAANNGGGTGEVNLQLWLSEPNITWEGGGIGTNVTNNGGTPAGFGRINAGLGQSYIRFLTNGGAMSFNTTDNAGTYFQTMYMNNGLVGIGTTAPAYKLNVVGQTLLSRDNATECCSGGDFTLALAENTAGTGRKAKISFHNSGVDEGAIELSHEAGFRSLKLFDHQNVTLGLYVTGNVRIGNVDATKPGYKLFVETGILTEKVKVAIKTSADWADHVFNKDYSLMPLKEVAQFIQANGHLPGVPSAAEVTKEGIDLGKMNAKLLEKIEELTLHLIAQQEKLDLLQKQMKQQNK
jgi:hypothetical protein